MPEKGLKNQASGCLVLIVPVAFLIVFVSSTWRFLLALILVAIAWNAWQLYQWRELSRRLDPIFQQAILANQGSITPLDLSLKSSISAQEANRYLEQKAVEFAAQKRDFPDKGTVYYFLTVKTLGTLFDESTPVPESELPPAVNEPIIAPQTASNIQIASVPSETATTASSAPAVSAEPPSDAETPPEAEAPQDLNMVALPPLQGAFSQDEPAASQVEEKQVPDPWQPESAIAHLKPLIQAELAKRLDVSASTVFKRREEPDFREWTMARDPDGVAWEYSAERKEFYPVEQA